MRAELLSLPEFNPIFINFITIAQIIVFGGMILKVRSSSSPLPLMMINCVCQHTTHRVSEARERVLLSSLCFLHSNEYLPVPWFLSLCS